MLKPIVLATAVSGTLDIVFALVLTLLYGRDPANMLRYVASGPFPRAEEMGATGAALGLLVHFTLMAVIVTMFVLAAGRVRDLTRAPLKWGVLYGLVTYVVINLLVVPLRFPAAFPPRPLSVATQLFAHVGIVGIPIALITARILRVRPAER